MLFLLFAALLQAPQLEVPRSMTIGMDEWHIILVKKINNSRSIDGLTECKFHTIFLLKNQDDRARADTLWHEIEHALTCDEKEVHNDLWNNDDESGEHEGIYWSAPKVAAFIAQNPQVIRYIQQAYGAAR